MKKHPSTTWKHANSVATHRKFNVEDPKKRAIDNNQVAQTLKKLGWKFWEGTSIWEVGYQLTFTKEIAGLQHPKLWFSFHWDNQGGEDFWQASCHSFYNYRPGYKYMFPGATFEVRHITKETLQYLPQMEEQILCALHTQEPLKLSDA